MFVSNLSNLHDMYTFVTYNVYIILLFIVPKFPGNLQITRYFLTVLQFNIISSVIIIHNNC